jgi:hypothetical protein
MSCSTKGGKKMTLLKNVIFVGIFITGISLGLLPGEQTQSSRTNKLTGIQGKLGIELSDISRTQILVLRTFHLRQLGDQFSPVMLDSLIAHLAKFKPDVIAVEAITPNLIYELKRKQEISSLAKEVLQTFASEQLKLGKMAQDILNISQVEAQQDYKRTFRMFVKDGFYRISSKQRARLILLMLAMYDPNSALLQWEYYKEDEKQTQSYIPKNIAEILEEKLKRVNEIPALAVRLALELGLQRLYPVDDFEDLDAVEEYLPQLKKEMAVNPLFKKTKKSEVYLEAEQRLAESITTNDLLSYYRFLNSAKYIVSDVQTQWGKLLQVKSSSGAARKRLGLWETRNLKITSHIRTVNAMHPGARILVIYGAAHKPFLEEYLSSLIDVKLKEFEDILCEDKS